MLGSFGDVVFEVSSERVRTFQEMNFTSGQTYAEHKILNGNTLLEYTGKNARTCNISIVLNSRLNLDIEDELKDLHELQDSHEPKILMLGGKVIGRFVIETLTESYKLIMKDGKILEADINLSLKEDMNE